MTIKVYVYNSHGGCKFFFHLDLPDNSTEKRIAKAIRKQVKEYNRDLTQKIRSWRYEVA